MTPTTSWAPAGRWARIAYALVIAGALLSIAQGVRNAVVPLGSIDMQWQPSRMLLEGRDPYAVLLQHYQEPGSPFPFMLSQAPFYPPYALVMFLPYGALPWDVARWCWAASNLAFFALVLMLLRRHFLADQPPWTSIAVGAIFACGTPLRNTIGNGQHGLLSLAAFLLAYDATVRWARPGVAVVPLAVSMFKYTIAGPLSIILVRRIPWRHLTVAGALLLLGSLIAGSMVHRPLAILPEYVHMLTVVSPRGFLDIFSLAAQTGISPGSAVTVAISLAVAALTTCCVLTRGRAHPLLSLSLLGFVSYALFFHHTYDLFILAFPLTFLFTPECRGRRALSALLTSTIALTWFIEKPLYLLRHQQPGVMAEMIYTGYWWTTAVVFYASAIAVGFALVARDRAGGGSSRGGRAA